MDPFEVHQVTKVYRKITCPRPGCRKGFLVDDSWPGGGGYVTRPCPFCFRVSRIPGGPALIYDSHETVSVTLEEAEALAGVNLIQYSPKDGPNGIMYRPRPGVTMEQVKNSLIREV